MKINIGAGRQTWNGYFCVDAVQHRKATRPLDLIHAFEFDGGKLLNPLPLDSEIADEVHNYHFIEHVYQWEAPALVAEFYRLLKPGGCLIMELPNLALSAGNLLRGLPDQYCMFGLYGDPGPKDPFMCHRWGYTPKTIADLLKRGGFRKITHGAPMTHGRKKNRDMRVEAIK